jgi:hypothetical protein
MKVPRQCPLVLLVKIGFRKSEAFGSEVRVKREKLSRALHHSIGIFNFDVSLRRATFGEIFMVTWRSGGFRATLWCSYWEGCLRGMQCNVEFGYQLSICFRTEENHVNREAELI